MSWPRRGWSRSSKQCRQHAPAPSAKVYVFVKQARDASANARGSVQVEANTTTTMRARRFTGPSCGGTATEIAAIAVPVLSLGGDVCFDGGARAGAPAPISVTARGELFTIDAAQDGRLQDSWGEFPEEGAFDAGSCDTDRDPACPRPYPSTTRTARSFAR